MKWLGISLTKKVKDFCTENHVILVKEVEDTNKRKIFHVRGLEELLFFVSILSKVIHRFSAISIKITMAIFTEMEQS